MSYVVLALKWRPQTFEEVAGQEPIAQTLVNAIRTGRTAHAYLFTGPRGVGKTSTARILAKALNCINGPTPEPCNTCDACREITGGRSLDVLEIDGASNRGIDDIRELRESVRYAPASTRTKVYIIDEVHMLTTDAFNALLKTLEEPPSHVVFVLCTTEPLKLPATIISRCQRYDFARLRVRDTLGRLRTIVDAEGIAIEDDALSLIARRAEGSMRDALTLCDQVIASGRSPLDAAGVASALGIAGRDLYFAISDAVLQQDPQKALTLLANAYDEGQNLQEVAEEMIHHLRNLLVLSVGPEMGDLLDATDMERERYRAQADLARPADLIRQLHIAMETAARMRRSGFPRVLLEVALAEICLLPRAVDLTAWLRNPGAAGATPQATGSVTGAAPSAPSSMPPSVPSSVPSSAPQSPTPPPMPPPASAAPPPRPARPASSARSTAGPRSSTTPPKAMVEAEPFGDSPVAVTTEAPPVPETATEEIAPELADPWAAVIQLVRRKRPALSASLLGSAVVGEDGGYLRVHLAAGATPFQRESLESPENRAAVQAAIQEAYGRAVGWRVEQGAAPASAMQATRPVDAPSPTSSGARSNLADIQRIARHMDGEIIGPA
jgi:DNA polymerase III subunit gamma/tau